MLTQSQFLLGPLTLHVAHNQTAIFACHLTIGELNTSGMNTSTANAGKGSALPVGADVNSDLVSRIEAQLRGYLEHRRATFDLPLISSGTDFQARVWEQLQQIPAGQTLTYGQLATRLNTAAQPIGGACKRNPIGFFVPCHRVVAAQAIGGYAGAWGGGPNIAVKRWLLDHEKGFSGAPH